ncbi:MAG: hypothetical protein Kow00106_01500 [Anaerolineae bacterium]
MSPDESSSRKPSVPRQLRAARGPRHGSATESIYRGALMRSRLEVRFAQELDRRGIAWQYEPERIGGGRYLVDFYLPDLKCWVEVKGRFEARDDLLLPNVANHLRAERGERLFLFMRARAFRVTWRGFEPLTLDEFWAALSDTTDEAGESLDYLRRRQERKSEDGER